MDFPAFSDSLHPYVTLRGSVVPPGAVYRVHNPVTHLSVFLYSLAMSELGLCLKTVITS